MIRRNWKLDKIKTSCNFDNPIQKQVAEINEKES